MGVFIIAEAGVNHNGKIDLAKQLVDMAVACGADAIKFQTFKAEECVTVETQKVGYQKESSPHSEETQYQMIKKLELSYEEFVEIKLYCAQKDILFLSTPDGNESLSWLVSLGVPKIKIGSTEVTNRRFLAEIAKTQIPIILSTGMSNLGEVERAIDTIKANGNENIELLHCTTDYPAKYSEVNLRAMVTMKEAFKYPVGLSDHTIGSEAAVAAVALGATIIEKHITLDKMMDGPDHKASMDFNEFKAFVKSIRNTEELLGNGIKKASKTEEMTKRQIRRSIIIAYPINAGTILTEEMIESKRSDEGIPVEYLEFIIGRSIRGDLDAGHSIALEDLI